MPSLIETLRKKYDYKCHYCGELTKKALKRHPPVGRVATREHIVPRAFGGTNSMDNYVLACAKCNGERGTQLFYCKCDICLPKIEAALSNDVFIYDMFYGIVKHNKPTVSFNNKRQLWEVRRGHTHRHFDTWAEAVDYGLNGTFMRGE